jgi:hypothetical protein
MSGTENPKSWWTTLPGVITSITAAVTALAGLVVAIKQTGWFDSDPPARTAAPASSTVTASRQDAAAPTAVAPPLAAPSPTKSAYPVGLPELRDYKVGAATFTLLKAQMSRQTTEKDALQIRVRMMNHGRYDANFWDRWFRLIVNEVPMAPESGLNEIVPAESAKEGDVIFVVPHGTARSRLKISVGSDSTEIPLALGAPR